MFISDSAEMVPFSKPFRRVIGTQPEVLSEFRKQNTQWLLLSAVSSRSQYWEVKKDPTRCFTLSCYTDKPVIIGKC